MSKISTMDEMARNVAQKALDEVYYKDKSIREWAKIILSEDAISKSKTLEHLKKRLYETAMNNVGCTLEKAKMDDISGVFAEIAENRIDTWINELPPIQPKAKVGRWISIYGNVKCSVCGNVKDGRSVGKATHYCDFCGAKMESEDKE